MNAYERAERMNAQALDLVRKLVAADQAPITAKKLIRLTNNATKGTEIVTATKHVCMTAYHVDYHMPISAAYFPLCFPPRASTDVHV